ncbi:hypothetical protein FKM82_010647 [Ascaphus truei]
MCLQPMAVNENMLTDVFEKNQKSDREGESMMHEKPRVISSRNESRKHCPFIRLIYKAHRLSITFNRLFMEHFHLCFKCPC